MTWAWIVGGCIVAFLVSWRVLWLLGAALDEAERRQMEAWWDE